MPTFGLGKYRRSLLTNANIIAGTWRSQPGQVEHAVEFALKNGYKSIDTATAYGNESLYCSLLIHTYTYNCADEVGQGIKKSGVPREEFFLTTKLNNPDMGRPKEALEHSLKELDTPYLDLCKYPHFFYIPILLTLPTGLMHWPAPMTPEGGADKSIDWLDTWHEMEKLYKAHPNKIKAIGVSNFSVEYLNHLLSNSEIVPAVNQIELHPSCPQQEVIDFCVSKGIAVTGYSPLGSEGAPLLKNPTVVKMAEKYGVKPGTILISMHANRPNVNGTLFSFEGEDTH